MKEHVRERKFTDDHDENVICICCVNLNVQLLIKGF